MKKVCLILLALCVSLITWANPVDVVTANSIAKKFLQSKVEEDCKARGLQRTQSQMEVDMALVYEPATEADVSEYYVFAPSDAEGFVIVSGEDTMEPIIGYSLTDKFSIQQMPQALENLLSSYAEYIDDVRAGKVEPVSQTTESIAPIFPFITTTWNQGYPYNYYCPEINGQRTVTGCVATAMAQVMKHYEWPTAGHGNCTATLADGYGTRVSITLGEKYDWSNMKDEYYSYTETEAQAVGALMRDVGYACALEYGVNATSGYTTSVLIAVLRHFDYSPSAHAIYKDYYSDAKWKELLYEELSAGHPIWYRGESQASGGHAFVFCGIDQNGGYYINWGWGGWCDGYFYLDALMPEGSNFNYAQQAIIGVKPIEKGEREEDYVAMPHIGKFEILAQSSSLSSPFVRCKIYVDNTSADALYGQVGYALYEDGEMISSDITILRGCQDLKPNWYFWSEDQLGFSNAASLSQGIREIRFFWRPNGSTEWYDALGDHCIYMKTTADGHSFFTDLKDIEDEEEKPEIPTAEIEDGCYYLKNIATGQFLTAANEWGTRASVGEHGVDVIITRQPNGKYIIDTQIGESEKHYLGLPDAFLYMDAAKIEWEIGVLENGNYVFTVDGGSTYMGYRGTVVYNNVTDPTTDEQVQWQLLTREDRIAGLKNASVDNPVDATFFILGANFGRLDYRNGIWADAPTINGNPVNYCAEKWNTTTFDVGQTITGLPNGLYELRVQGFYREGGTATPEIAANNYAAGKSVLNAMLYANEESTPLMSIMEEAKKGTAPDADYYTTSMGYVPHSQTGASNSFSEGGYQHRLQVGVTDGTLRIGIRKDAVSVYDWTCFDNFELYYCGASVLIPEYTVTFYDWDGTVLKVEMVKQGQSATAPSDPVREGYTFTGWDKSFSNVQSDLSVTATYTQNVQPEPEPEPEPELQYTIEFHAGANGWIEGTVWYDQTQKIAGYTSPLYRSQQGKVEKLRITVNRTAGNTKYFCLSEFQFFDADGQQITLAASSIASNADHNALNPTVPDGGGFAALLDG